MVFYTLVLIDEARLSRANPLDQSVHPYVSNLLAQIRQLALLRKEKILSDSSTPR